MPSHTPDAERVSLCLCPSPSLSPHRALRGVAVVEVLEKIWAAIWTSPCGSAACLDGPFSAPACPCRTLSPSPSLSPFPSPFRGLGTGASQRSEIWGAVATGVATPPGVLVPLLSVKVHRFSSQLPNPQKIKTQHQTDRQTERKRTPRNHGDDAKHERVAPQSRPLFPAPCLSPCHLCYCHRSSSPTPLPKRNCRPRRRIRGRYLCFRYDPQLYRLLHSLVWMPICSYPGIDQQKQDELLRSNKRVLHCT